MKCTMLLVLILSIAATGSALAMEKNGGLAASYVTPDGDFDDLVDPGWGLSAIFDYNMAQMVDISGSVGWYRFGGTTRPSGLQTVRLNVWEFAAGPQFDFGKLYLGVEGAYSTNIDEWGFVPNIGFRKDLIDIGVRYKMTEDSNYYAVRAGFFF